MRELPYYGQDFISFHGRFNNSNNNTLPTKKYLDNLTSIYDLDLFSLNTRNAVDTHDNFHKIYSNYYSPHSYSVIKFSKETENNNFSMFHTNIRSLRKNFDNFETHLLHELDFQFSIIGLTETRITNVDSLNFECDLPGYVFEYVPTPLAAGGVGMYIDKTYKYTILEKCSNEAFQSLWIEIHNENSANIICGIIYRQHNSPDRFQVYFDETIERLSSTNKTIYLMGDFNINLLHSETCNFAQNFLLSLQSLNLMPTIDKPTRIHNKSATLIDNIFINKIGQPIYSGNIVSDLSDHYSQFCILKRNDLLTNSTKSKTFFRDYSCFSEVEFKKDLGQIDFENSINDDIDKSFSFFFKKLNKITNKHAPLKPISRRKVKQQSKPWITKGIRRSIKIKNSLFYHGNRKTYKLYRNKLLELTRISKRKYYQEYFTTNFANHKKTWEGINKLINRKKRYTKSIASLKCPGSLRTTTDPSKISNILNKHFSSVGHNLASKIPESSNSFTKYLPKESFPNSFVFELVSPNEIEKEIMAIPLNKAHGLFSCPVRILRWARLTLSKPLSDLFNMSIQNGTYPSKLKFAKVIPVHKGNDELIPTNYRPISLLSIFNRILEKLVCIRIKNFLDKYNILFRSQYGFREKHSTQHAILDIVNQIQTNMDNNLFSCGIFIDLQKAFDTVNHAILVKKLHFYGIRGVVNDWFLSYLSNRTQTVQIGDSISDKCNVLTGIPQGSVLGPLLFILYINDIYTSSSKLKFYLFADDTNLLFADKNLKSLEHTVNNELLHVNDWLAVNKLSLNIDKSNFVIFHPHQKRINYKVNIKVFDNNKNTYISLEQKEYVKYLGILIDNNLTWKHHISHIASKISKTIGVIARLRHFLPTQTLIQIYNSLILPYLSYGLMVWGQASKRHINKISILQKRVLRLIYFGKYTSHAIPFFVSANILPLDLLYFKTVATQMHDISNHLTPPDICDLFTTADQIHNYNTRSSAKGNYFVQYSRLNKQKNSFSRTGVRIWNSIPLHTRDFSKHLFKKKIHSELLQMLSEEDEYIEVAKLVKLFSKV